MKINSGLRVKGVLKIYSNKGLIYEDNNVVTLEGKNKLLSFLVGNQSLGVNCIILSYSNVVASESNVFSNTVYRQSNNIIYHSILDGGFLHKDLNNTSSQNLYDNNSFNFVLNSDGSVKFIGILGNNYGNDLPYNQIWSLNLCGGVSLNFFPLNQSSNNISGGGGLYIDPNTNNIISTRSSTISNSGSLSINPPSGSTLVIQERTTPPLNITGNEFLLARRVLNSPIIKQTNTYLIFEWLIKLV